MSDENTALEKSLLKDQAIGMVVARIALLHEDFGEMKGALKEMANAISKIALVEERQQQAALAQERTFKGLEKLEARLEKLEAQAPLNLQNNKRIERIVIGVFTLIVAIVMYKLQLLG
jgi:Mg2+ and Co2+ transporter CorA